jgi:hypothetical protein
MRLSEIYNAVSNLDIENSRINIGSSGSAYKISNLKNFKNLIKQVKEYQLDFYKEQISFLEKSEMFSSTQDSLILYDDKLYVQIRRTALYILDSIDALNKVLISLIPQSSENDFLIKLPKPENFEFLLKDMNKIQKQLSILVNDESINSSYNIQNWEYGSFWLNVAFSTVVTVEIIASITWASAYIASQVQKYEENSLYLKQISIKTEMLEELQKTHSTYLKQLIDSEVSHINEKHFDNTNDNERDKKVKDTITLFSDIISRGGEFQPSLIAPKEIKESFPDFNLLESIPSKVKQIAYKKEESE